MDGHQVLKHLLDIAYENLSIFTISTFTFATVTGILLYSNIGEPGSERLAMKHDMGSIASSLNCLQNQVQDFTLRLDLQNTEQDNVRKIITKLESKQDRLEESLYSEE